MSKIIFEDIVEAEPKTPLTHYLKKAPFKIKTPCGKGKCGKCTCIVSGETNPPTERELKLLSENKLKQGYRLACEVLILGDVHIRKAPKTKKKAT